MGKKLYPEESIQSVAEAIRNKNGLTNKYKISEMAEAINNLGIYSLSGEDNAPYLYRKTPLTSDAELDKIVGGSVVFNQLVKVNNIRETRTLSGVTFTNNGDGSVTLSGTATAETADVGSWQYVSFIASHKYYVVTADGNKTIDLGSERVVSLGAFIIQNGVTYNKTTFCQLIDLTQMFGTTIADYVYQLEQSTAGAGVAWFKQLFPKDYYEYNAGEIKSVSGLSSHDMVGFNQWDEEWELGGIDATTGQNYVSNSTIRSKGYIPVIGGETYNVYIAGSTSLWIAILTYDAEKNFIANAGGKLGGATFTLNSNVSYIRFYVTSNYGTTYNNDICINISDTNRNGEYEPYIKHSYPLDNTLTLRGIPKLSDGKLFYDGDVYNSDGSVVRKYGVVDLGTLNWSYEQGRDLFETLLVPRAKNLFDAVCSNYPFVGSYSILVDKSCGYIYGYHFAIKDSTYGTDATAFKTAMQGVYLIYELAEPTTETAEPYSTIQICDGAGTEEYVTTGIPVGHETKYLENLQ